jgi:hypothetical protein
MQRMPQRTLAHRQLPLAAVEPEPPVANPVAVRKQREARQQQRIGGVERFARGRAQPVHRPMRRGIVERRQRSAQFGRDHHAARAVAQHHQRGIVENRAIEIGRGRLGGGLRGPLGLRLAGGRRRGGTAVQDNRSHDDDGGFAGYFPPASHSHCIFVNLLLIIHSSPMRPTHRAPLPVSAFE